MPGLRLLYRVVTGAPAGRVDVEIRLAGDATVGEAADALADHLRSLGHPVPVVPTLGAGGIRREARAADGAPHSGSTVHLSEATAATVAPPWWSPVSLQGLTNPTPEPMRLAYGTTRVGPGDIDVAERIVVRATGSTDRLELDGAAVRGSTTARPGSILTVGDTTVVVRCDGPLRPPARTGPFRPHGRIPAVVEPHEPVPVQLPTPPGDQRRPGFPILSAMVPLLMGVALWYATGSVAVAGFVLFSFVLVLASGLENRREFGADRRFRERAFRAELQEACSDLADRRRHQVDRAARAAPTASEIIAWVDHDPCRLWERRLRTDGAVTVRLGRERVPGEDPAVPASDGRRDLRDEADRAVAEFDPVEVPGTVDLDGVGCLALVGVGDGPAALARSVLCQLAGLLDPNELSIRVIGHQEHAADWDWVRWLPHAARTDTPVPGPGHRRVVLVAGGDTATTAGGETGSETGNETGNETGSEIGCDELTIWIAGCAAGLPEHTGAVVELVDGSCTLRRGDGAPTPLVPELVSVDEAEPLARRLAAFRIASSAPPPPPDRVTLGDVLDDPDLLVDPAAVATAWSASRNASTGCRAPVGVTGGGVIVFDLGADGPHGLVAGTTGSGKSELLRTLVASLALHHPPDRLTFLFIDYKGGAAFGSAVQLPHAVGLVTDLTPALARRALTSLRAEIRHRESAVAAAGVTDVSELPPDAAPPGLVVVVDEFATLARDIPEFVDGLLDLAQRGRSLGIHLLLATQRPGGVVTDAIRANLSFRVALRVTDEDDSRDVVDTPAAAHLPRERPGRAILRTGPRHTTEVQLAHTTAPVGRPSRARCVDLHRTQDEAPAVGRAVDGPVGPTELDAVLAVCRAAADRLAVPAPRRPWLDPLPTELVAEQLPRTSTPGEIVLGLIDRPEAQRRDPLVIDLATRGGLLVLGGPGSGRTTTLGALAAAAVSHPSDRCVAYGVDGSRDLAGLLGMAGIGDVVSADDLDRTLRLLRAVHQELRRRSASEPAGPVPQWQWPLGARLLVLVDGVGAVEDRHSAVNRGEAIELLTRLAADGRGLGIHVAVSAGRRAEVPPALLAALDRRLVLRCPADDAVLAGVAPDLEIQDAPPGRGVLDGAVVQVVRPPATRHPGVGTAAVPTLPTDVPLGQLVAPEGWMLPIALDAQSLLPVALDLSFHHALVVGPPRSGRTSALRTIATQAAAAHPGPGLRVVWVDGTRDDEAGLADGASRARDGERLLVVIDDLPELLDGPHGGTADALIAELMSIGTSDAAGVRVVGGAESDALLRCYGESVRRLRAGRTGVLLRPDRDLHPGILHTTLPLHDELAPAPGRGWLLNVDEPRAVQLAH